MKRVKALIKTGMIALLLMVITACGNGGKTKYTLEMAQNYLLEGNYEEAILAYTALIEIDPSDTSLYMQRADAYVYTEQYQNAIDDFTVVIQNEPENTSRRGEVVISGRFWYALPMANHSVGGRSPI